MQTIAIENEKGRAGAAIRLDADLLEDIYRRYYKNVYNYMVFRISNHHDAEELVATVFSKAIDRWKSYNPAFAIEGWLIGIAKNTATDYLRGLRRRRTVALDAALKLPSPNREPEQAAITNEEHRTLLAAMARLKEPERQILSMKFATDLRHRQIAEILGISESGVRVKVHRALTKLRKIMEVEM